MDNGDVGFGCDAGVEIDVGVEIDSVMVLLLG